MRGACIRHGVVADVSIASCPTCDEPLVDLDDPEVLAMLRAAHGGRRPMRIGLLALLSAVLVLALAVALKGSPDLDRFELMSAVAVLTTVLYFATLPFVPLRMRQLESAIHAPRKGAGDALAHRVARALTSTPVLVAVAALVVYLVERQLGASDHLGLALVPSELSDSSRWHTLITHAAVHGSLSHLVGNGIALLFFGLAVDSRVGRRGALVLFVAGVLGGAALSMVIGGHPDAAHVGMSGGVYGMAGAALALMPRRKFVFQISFGGLMALPAFVYVPALIAVFAAYDYVAHPWVDWAAHVGGALAGALVALPMRRLAEPEAHRLAEAARAERLEKL